MIAHCMIHVSRCRRVAAAASSPPRRRASPNTPTPAPRPRPALLDTPSPQPPANHPSRPTDHQDHAPGEAGPMAQEVGPKAARDHGRLPFSPPRSPSEVAPPSRRRRTAVATLSPRSQYPQSGVQSGPRSGVRSGVRSRPRSPSEVAPPSRRRRTAVAPQSAPAVGTRSRGCGRGHSRGCGRGVRSRAPFQSSRTDRAATAQ